MIRLENERISQFHRFQIRNIEALKSELFCGDDGSKSKTNRFIVSEMSLLRFYFLLSFFMFVSFNLRNSPQFFPHTVSSHVTNAVCPAFGSVRDNLRG